MIISVKNFLRDLAPGVGTALVMMLMYPFIMILFGIACILGILPLVFAFGAYGSGEYFWSFLWLLICGGVVFVEYEFYKWSAKPERTITGFKEIMVVVFGIGLFVYGVSVELLHSWIANHHGDGYNPVVFILAAPKHVGLALRQPFLSARPSSISEIFNMWEAFAWCLIGLLCVARSLWGPVSYRMKLLFATGINFLVFGLTDVYEMRTGAWWDPVGLLVIKVSCVLVFVTLYYLHRKNHAC